MQDLEKQYENVRKSIAAKKLIMSPICDLNRINEKCNNDFVDAIYESACALQNEVSSASVKKYMIQSLIKLCAYHFDAHVLEDDLNDRIRDMLDMVYDVRDQTRQGTSESKESNGAGEVDLLIKQNGVPLALYEGMRLDCLDKTVLDRHVKKALCNYNPQGIKEVYISVYYFGLQSYDSFWEKLGSYLKEKKDNNGFVDIYWDDEEFSCSSVRLLNGYYFRNGMKHNLIIMSSNLSSCLT